MWYKYMHISYWSSIFLKGENQQKKHNLDKPRTPKPGCWSARFCGCFVAGGFRTLPHLSREFRCLPGLHALPGVNPEMGEWKNLFTMLFGSASVSSLLKNSSSWTWTFDMSWRMWKVCRWVDGSQFFDRTAMLIHGEKWLWRKLTQIGYRSQMSEQLFHSGKLCMWQFCDTSGKQVASRPDWQTFLKAQEILSHSKQITLRRKRCDDGWETLNYSTMWNLKHPFLSGCFYRIGWFHMFFLVLRKSNSSSIKPLKMGPQSRRFVFRCVFFVFLFGQILGPNFPRGRASELLPSRELTYFSQNGILSRWFSELPFRWDMLYNSLEGSFWGRVANLPSSAPSWRPVLEVPMPPDGPPSKTRPRCLPVAGVGGCFFF